MVSVSLAFTHFLWKNSVTRLPPQSPNTFIPIIFNAGLIGFPTTHSHVIYFMVTPINVKWTFFTTVWKRWDDVKAVINYYMDRVTCSMYLLLFCHICHCILMAKHQEWILTDNYLLDYLLVISWIMPFQRNFFVLYNYYL